MELVRGMSAKHSKMMIANKPSLLNLFKSPYWLLTVCLVGERCVNFKAFQLKMVKVINTTETQQKHILDAQGWTPRSNNIQLNPIVGGWHPATLQHDMLHSPQSTQDTHTKGPGTLTCCLQMSIISTQVEVSRRFSGAKETQGKTGHFRCGQSPASQRCRPQACCFKRIS